MPSAGAQRRKTFNQGHSMFDTQQRAFIALSGEKQLCLLPGMANRHGLISGATGTGKTVTVQTLAETFSQMGVPVFAADIKGDLSGVAASGGNKESVVKRVAAYHLGDFGFSFQAFPVQFWDVFGELGAPVRARVADMGPLLLSRLLDLNETQTAVLTIIFKIAHDEKLDLVDLKDLRATLAYVLNNARTYNATYGRIAAASVGAIQRGLATLEHQGAEAFFGEPSLNIEDLLRTESGQGVINILAADRLMHSPKVYTSFLLWLLSALYDRLPEIGDPEKPRLVFFFDEAHLFFNDAPKALLEKMEQIARLIRSKGVGIYFISQSPGDIPDAILGQLGNRVQHALRAYTPNDQKKLKAAAGSFRANPGFDTKQAITELGTGEALVSFLDSDGAPHRVERGFILPPQGCIGPLAPAVRQAMLEASPIYRLYSQAVDRRTAHEILDERLRNAPTEKELAAREKARLAAEKQQQREAERHRRYWGGVIKSVLVPVARQVISSFFKKR